MRNRKALEYTREMHPHLERTIEPLFVDTPVTGFVYMELLSPDKFFFLGTDPMWGEEYLIRGSPGETWVEGLKHAATRNCPTTIAWTMLESPDPVEQYCIDLGYRYGINIYKKEHNKIKLWGFNGCDPKSSLFFQTQSHFLEDFILYFNNEYHDFMTGHNLESGTAYWEKPLILPTESITTPHFRSKFQKF